MNSRLHFLGGVRTVIFVFHFLGFMPHLRLFGLGLLMDLGKFLSSWGRYAFGEDGLRNGDDVGEEPRHWPLTSGSQAPGRGLLGWPGR